ncbi:hypothetical protein JX266_007170 [Neoarthrinium moseri]|uniref:uncharacterized protein n=1 Tax=Neoarthrinium moseri TaxID=1658444 RepID=UPI001FDD9FCC|nr:uncharacterized protein JN550_011484 [Neoarthrinium moseri]KAI1846597.1 hypothetical protein JX266_007170 [Neoarthrinium moseri]KAI1860636.1 hypothetical protein JN550_011484 [Neoarthrinium moseri]
MSTPESSSFIETAAGAITGATEQVNAGSSTDNDSHSHTSIGHQTNFVDDNNPHTNSVDGTTSHANSADNNSSHSNSNIGDTVDLVAKNNASNDGSLTPISNDGVVFMPYSEAQNPDSVKSCEREEFIECLEDGDLAVEHFVKINSAHFHRYADDTTKVAPESTLLTIRADGGEFFIHRAITKKSHMLNSAFAHRMKEGLSGIIEFEGDYKVWMIVLLAMYGAKQLPLGFIKHNAAVYVVKALEKADYVLAEESAKENVASMLTARLATFKTWKDHPLDDLEYTVHEDRVAEISEAFVAYRDCVATYKPFDLFGFGILVHTYCPNQIYQHFEDLWDDALFRYISRAGKTGPGGPHPSASALKLFMAF